MENIKEARKALANISTTLGLNLVESIYKEHIEDINKISQFITDTEWLKNDFNDAKTIIADYKKENEELKKWKVEEEHITRYLTDTERQDILRKSLHDSQAIDPNILATIDNLTETCKTLREENEELKKENANLKAKVYGEKLNIEDLQFIEPSVLERIDKLEKENEQYKNSNKQVYEELKKTIKQLAITDEALDKACQCLVSATSLDGVSRKVSTRNANQWKDYLLKESEAQNGNTD